VLRGIKNMSENYLEEIKKLSSEINDGISEMVTAVDELNNSLDNMPLLVKPFVRGDFRREMGMDIEEWLEFLEDLNIRISNINDIVESVTEGTNTLSELQTISEHFTQRSEHIARKIREFADYTRNAQEKIEKAPSQFINVEIRKQAEMAPKHAEDMEYIADNLERLSDKLNQLSH
jgi:uncharacterized phage infection (PIP) family protein YhgE